MQGTIEGKREKGKKKGRVKFPLSIHLWSGIEKRQGGERKKKKGEEGRKREGGYRIAGEGYRVFSLVFTCHSVMAPKKKEKKRRGEEERGGRG